MDIIYGLLESFWRRWFGGMFEDYFESKGLSENSTWYTKLLCSRGTQTIVNILFLWYLFYVSFTVSGILTLFPDSWNIEKYKLYISLYHSLMFQFLFWSKGHGPIFDYGHNTTPSEDTIRRYNEFWWTKYLNKFWNSYLIKYFPIYGYTYDLVSMFIRYTYPCLILSLTVGMHIIPLGLLITAVYSMMWGIYDDNPNWYVDKKLWFNGPTKIAELLAGYCVGVYLM